MTPLASSARSSLPSVLCGRKQAPSASQALIPFSLASTPYSKITPNARLRPSAGGIARGPSGIGTDKEEAREGSRRSGHALTQAPQANRLS